MTSGLWKRVLLWLLGGFVVAVFVVGVALVWWGTHPLGPEPAALAALESTGGVRVTQASDGWEFAPASRTPTAALVFYPGGHVDARSYSEYARDLAKKGYLVVIPVMPLSLAVLNANAADKVVGAHPGISRWVIGGHSLGGAMAAQYAARHPGSMSGLVLLAAYAPSGDDLSRTGIAALTEVGTLDSVVNRTNLADGEALLPPSAARWNLNGGNHAQFGNYGPQPKDNPNPTMPASVQRGMAVIGTKAVLDNVEPVQPPDLRY